MHVLEMSLAQALRGIVTATQIISDDSKWLKESSQREECVDLVQSNLEVARVIEALALLPLSIWNDFADQIEGLRAKQAGNQAKNNASAPLAGSSPRQKAKIAQGILTTPTSAESHGTHALSSPASSRRVSTPLSSPLASQERPMAVSRAPLGTVEKVGKRLAAEAEVARDRLERSQWPQPGDGLQESTPTQP